MLVVGPNWVGDMVMAQSLFETLKRQHPDRAIDVLAPTWTRPLLARMPQVRNGIDLPLGHGQLGLAVRRELGRSLRERHYEQAIVLPGSWKSALIPWFARISQRTGYRGEWRYGLLNDIRPLDKTRLPMTVQRFVTLGLPHHALLPPPVPLPYLTIDPTQRANALLKLGLLRTDTPLLALCPGAEYGPAKRWPVEHYAAVARAKLAEGWQVWLFGSNKDQPVAAAIQAQLAGQCTDLTGRTDLAQAIDLLSLAEAVVSNDSGLMHVAAALGRKLVAVYGSSDPGFTPPLHEPARIIWQGLACSPCFKRECPLGHLRCLREITPERVLQELATL